MSLAVSYHPSPTAALTAMSGDFGGFLHSPPRFATGSFKLHKDCHLSHMDMARRPSNTKTVRSHPVASVTAVNLSSGKIRHRRLCVTDANADELAKSHSADKDALGRLLTAPFGQ